MVRIRSFGKFAFRITDVPAFMREIFGTKGIVMTYDIVEYLSSMAVSYTHLVEVKKEAPVQAKAEAPVEVKTEVPAEVKKAAPKKTAPKKAAAPVEIVHVQFAGDEWTVSELVELSLIHI